MAVQPITRQALLNKMTNVIKNLPDDQLQQAWAQIDGWATPGVADGQDSVGQRVADDEEGLTFDVTPKVNAKIQYLRLPLRITKSVTKAVMEVSNTLAG